MSKSKDHQPRIWANDAAVRRAHLGGERVKAMTAHRGESAKPVRMTTAESSRAIAKELRSNSRRNFK